MKGIGLYASQDKILSLIGIERWSPIDRNPSDSIT